jgi:hypothetical protein
MVVISESEKGMRSYSDRIPFCLLRDADRESADDRPTGTATDTTGSTDSAREPSVDGDSAACRAASVSSRIALVIITDDATANYRTQNRADDGTSGRTAADTSVVTTRRRAARIGNRDRLRTPRNRSRVDCDRLWRNRLGLSLRNGGRGFCLNDLRRRLRSRTVTSHAGRGSLLAGRRSRPLDRRHYLRCRIVGAVGESDPVVRGGELQILLEIIVHRRFLATAAGGQKHGTRSSKQQVRLPHKKLLPMSRE